MDVICAQCGEPFGYYGIDHGDFEPEDIEPFLKGEYCPCCKDHPERRTGQFLEGHFATLMEATDDPDRFMQYLPW
jgi:hypothetical protein